MKTKIERMSDEELAKVQAWLQSEQDAEDPEDPEPTDKIVAISGIVVDPIWARKRRWYKSVCKDLKKYDSKPLPPTYLVRTMNLANTGWNILVRVTKDGYSTWGEGDECIDLEDGTTVKIEMWTQSLYGSGPAYSGCYEEDEEGNNISDPEALAWVPELYENINDVWF